MAKIFRNINRKEQNLKYNKKGLFSRHFSFEAIFLIENIVRNYLIL